MKEIKTSKGTNTNHAWVIMNGYASDERVRMLYWLELNMPGLWQADISRPFRIKITFFDEKYRTMFLLKWG